MELSDGESVIMHSQSAIVHYPSQPNGSTTVSDDLSHPKSVLRGFAEVEKVDSGRWIRKGCVCVQYMYRRTSLVEV